MSAHCCLGESLCFGAFRSHRFGRTCLRNVYLRVWDPSKQENKSSYLYVGFPNQTGLQVWVSDITLGLQVQLKSCTFFILEGTYRKPQRTMGSRKAHVNPQWDPGRFLWVKNVIHFGISLNTQLVSYAVVCVSSFGYFKGTASELAKW